MADTLRVVVRTPHALAVDVAARSLRVPTDTGQVGVRRGMEPAVLAVEAGLVLIRTDQGVRFAGVAGGLLTCDGNTATLFTPLVVTGDDEDAVKTALERELAAPTGEIALRNALNRLEQRILDELRRSSEPQAPVGGGQP